MSDGENIPPVPIENRIKNEIPFLSNVMVVGDERSFLTCLMTLKVHFHTCSYPTCSYSGAIFAGPVNPVSTVPLLPSLVSCLVSPISAVARLMPTQCPQSTQVMCWSLQDGCKQCEKLLWVFFQQFPVLLSKWLALFVKVCEWTIRKLKPGQGCTMQWAER